jgi:ribonuclease HI
LQNGLTILPWFWASKSLHPQYRSYPQWFQKGPTVLDRLLVHVVGSKPTDSDMNKKLYGPVFFDTNAVTVYTDGSCLHNGTRDATAGYGVFWGENHSWNTAGRVPGKQTNQRGELLAVVYALACANPLLSLHVYSDSHYAIKSVVYWAAQHSARGWRCDNGDILKVLTQMVARRVAPTKFSYVKGHSGNKHNDASDALAKEGAAMSPVASIIMPDLPPVPDFASLGLNTLSVAKVSTELAEVLLPDTASQPMVVIGEPQGSHRGRERWRTLQSENLQLLVDAESDAQFWKSFRKLADPKPVAPLVSLEALKISFMTRMNPLDPLPQSFNTAHLEFNKVLNANIPEQTVDSTPEQFFSHPFSVSEIELAKDRLRKHSKASATGIEGISYMDIQDMDNDELVHLVNSCLDSNDAPSIWFSTLLTGVLKKGKPASNPDSYRTIGLESCLLKLVTLLIHLRLTEWASARAIIPPSQNGFRETYRTNNNAFILRCSIDKARSLGKTLYVGSVDISNAFPSTEHATMWVKLLRHGAGGKIFDWLRMLYQRMAYVVRLGSSLSESFKALIGILIGDPASPTLWNLFLADLVLPPDPEDVILDGISMSNLEHADDMLLMSYSAGGLQRKMNAVYFWCSINFMQVNAVKSMIAIFGKLPQIIPPFTFGDAAVKVVERFTYVGVTFQTTHANVFASHYSTKASKARVIGHAILGVESMIGSLPPLESRKLYMARVDPHLISGCEVTLDVDDLALQLLDVQHSYLRRLLKINKRSMIAPLFTETAVAPLQYRRIQLALRYLAYLISLPVTHYAHAALKDSVSLFQINQPCWVTDLRHVLLNLPKPVALPDIVQIDTDGVAEIIKEVATSMKTWLNNEMKSPKMYLLQGRLEPQKDKPAKRMTLHFRHYLLVPTTPHRKSLCRLLLSDHCLALEQLRRSQGPYIPREHRLCRFCTNAIESPEHALLECTASSDLVLLRNMFVERIRVEMPVFSSPHVSLTSLECLKALVANRPTIALLAKYTHDALLIFDACPIYNPFSTADSFS